jgi:hypothetical protein
MLERLSIKERVMDTALLDRRFFIQLQQNPLDLRRVSAADAARALVRVHPTSLRSRGRVLIVVAAGSREAGLRSTLACQLGGWAGRMGVLLTLGESMWLTEFDLRHDHRPEVLLQSGQGWYTEPYHRFDVGFIERTRPASSES